MALNCHDTLEVALLRRAWHPVAAIRGRGRGLLLHHLFLLLLLALVSLGRFLCRLLVRINYEVFLEAPRLRHRLLLKFDARTRHLRLLQDRYLRDFWDGESAALTRLLLDLRRSVIEGQLQQRRLVARWAIAPIHLIRLVTLGRCGRQFAHDRSHLPEGAGGGEVGTTVLVMPSA